MVLDAMAVGDGCANSDLSLYLGLCSLQPCYLVYQTPSTRAVTTWPGMAAYTYPGFMFLIHFFKIHLLTN